MILATVALVVIAIVVLGLAAPRRPARRDAVDIVFRTRLEANGVEVRSPDRIVAGALIAGR